MKVAILTSGRFHVLDLARELDRLGHDVAFYSLVPPSTTRRFGLPDRCNRWLGLAGPAWLAARALRQTPLASRANQLLAETLDRVAARVLRPADAFIGMAGLSLHSLTRMKRLGAVTFLERGSMHIAAQKAILDARGRPTLFSPWLMKRESTEYAESDFISIPSAHAEQSFLERGFPRERLLRNPYGVSLTQFPPTAGPSPSPRRLLFVGNWSWQKGADLLTEAFLTLSPTHPDLELHHVGALTDVPFPSHPRAFHHPPVPQPELTRFYANAHLFVLPSRQEGLAMVLSQSLASGVPVVCSDRSGGLDLRPFVGNPDAITVTPAGDRDALTHAIAAQLMGLTRPFDEAPLRDLLGETGRRELTWEAYARRWSSALETRVSGRTNPMKTPSENVH